ncbi:MAG: class I SAM-dependent methyltransferase [Clostridia bacterium]
MKLVRENLFEEVIPYNERPKEEKEIINQFDKKLESGDWEEAYDKDDDHWMKDMKPSILAFELIKDLDRENKKHANILEIGIGNGRDSIFFAKKGHIVTGIDIAEQPVKTAKKNIKGTKNVKFEVGKAEKLKYKDGSFDAVYSIAALHSSILYDTFGEIYRVLNPEGIAKLYLYTKTKSGKKWMIYWTPEQIKSIAKEIGFKLKKFRTGHNIDKIEIPEIEGEVEQESFLAIMTFKK